MADSGPAITYDGERPPQLTFASSSPARSHTREVRWSTSHASPRLRHSLAEVASAVALPGAAASSCSAAVALAGVRFGEGPRSGTRSRGRRLSFGMKPRQISAQPRRRQQRSAASENRRTGVVHAESGGGVGDLIYVAVRLNHRVK